MREEIGGRTKEGGGREEIDQNHSVRTIKR